jgi:hypothetical protein
MSPSTTAFSSDHSTMKPAPSGSAVVPITIYANESFGRETSDFYQTSCKSNASRVKLPQKFPILKKSAIKLQLDDLTRDWEEQSHGLLYHLARRSKHDRQQGAGSFIESNIEGDMVRGVAYQNSSHIHDNDPHPRRVQLRAETGWISKQDCTVLPPTDRFSQGAITLTGVQAVPPPLEQEYYKSLSMVSIGTSTASVQPITHDQARP